MGIERARHDDGRVYTTAQALEQATITGAPGRWGSAP